MASASITIEACGSDDRDSGKSKEMEIPSTLHGPEHGNLELSASFKSTTKVALMFMWNLSNVHVMPLDDFEALRRMNGIIDRHLQNDTLIPLISVPPKGYLMLTAYYDEYLYRGQVIRVDGDKVDVFFVDFGDCVLNVLYSDCYEIPEEVRKAPIKGIVFHVLDVPAEAETWIGPKARGAMYCDGTIQVMEKKTPFFWVGRFYDEGNKEWSQRLREVMYARGVRFPMSVCFNPWSMACLETLKGKGKESLRAILAKKYGSEFLLRISEFCFPKYKEKVKAHQKALLEKKCKTGKETLKRWSDMDFGFYYSENDVPQMKVPGGSDVDIHISYFTSPFDWGAALISEPYKTYRKELSRKLKDFCEGYDGPSLFNPVPERLYFVKVLTWAEIDNMMTKEKEELGQKWEPRYHRRCAADDEDANQWFRGIAVGHCGSTPTHSMCYEFYLIDTGRFVPVLRYDIVPAVFRFLIVPCLGIRGTFALKYMGVKKAYHDDMYKAVPRGTKLACTIISGISRDRTLVLLPESVEEKLFENVRAYKDFDSLPKELKYKYPHNLEERVYNGIFM